MKKFGTVVLGVSLAAAACICVPAQDMNAPPKVLEIQREFLKPGKAGMMHDRSESNFVQAFTRAKWPTHYVALNSLSGKTRALYLMGYDSFAAWQKDAEATAKNPALANAIDRTEMSDGELLSDSDQYVFYYQPDLSLRADGGLAFAKYMEVTSFHLHPGHHKEWTDLVKMVMEAHQRAGTSAHWATYELEYGGGDEYVIFSADKDMGEIDTGFAEGKKFDEAMGEDGLKKLDAMVADCIVSVDAELFSINPRQSYPPEDWVKANPDFWKPKPMMTAAPGTEKMKPMAKPGQ